MDWFVKKQIWYKTNKNWQRKRSFMSKQIVGIRFNNLVNYIGNNVHVHKTNTNR